MSIVYRNKLTRYYAWYTLVFVLFLVCLAMLEREGVPRAWIGYLFIFVTVALYAGIGIISRTSNIVEYYVAGRRVPGIFNGMATAADWISAASFLSLAGGLYLQGFDGFAYVIGWTGGFCLVALLIAPYLRKFGQYTIPDFLETRFQQTGKHNRVRLLAVLATLCISFTYVVAQIYGVGLITSRFTGVDFSVGIFLGLASILVCSFLGGMRAVTWTQVAQCIIILIAYLVPTTWMSLKHTHNPIPQLAYHSVLPALAEKEKRIAEDPREREVREMFRKQAQAYQEQIARLPQSWAEGRAELERQLNALKAENGSLPDVKSASRKLAAYPKSAQEAQTRWQEMRATLLQHGEYSPTPFRPYLAKDEAASNAKRNNFMALVACLMFGTAAMPHILVRFYTPPSVRESRESVFWSLFFIMLMYTAIPALAIFVKFDIMNSLVGTEFSRLPEWVSYWSGIDKQNPLLNLSDVNHDGVLQWSEILLDGDILVLASPEIAGLPYVVSALVAAGGLAAALSTADGLLLTISNSLSHDIYYKIVDPAASTQKRVTISKLLLLVVAIVAAYVASLKPADILSMVGAAFSLAASALFPSLVAGIFWKRANHHGAVWGMLAGFAVCVIYMMRTHPLFGGSVAHQWFHISAISAGVFGVPTGMLVLVCISLMTPPPEKRASELLEFIRSPDAG